MAVLDWHVKIRNQFTYQRKTPPARPVRNSGHTALCAQCGSYGSRSFVSKFLMSQQRTGRGTFGGMGMGRQAYQAAEKNGCDGACVSETCQYLGASCTLQVVVVWEGRGEAVTDTPRADFLD